MLDLLGDMWSRFARCIEILLHRPILSPITIPIPIPLKYRCKSLHTWKLKVEGLTGWVTEGVLADAANIVCIERVNYGMDGECGVHMHRPVRQQHLQTTSSSRPAFDRRPPDTAFPRDFGSWECAAPARARHIRPFLHIRGSWPRDWDVRPGSELYWCCTRSMQFDESKFALTKCYTLETCFMVFMSVICLQCNHLSIPFHNFILPSCRV